jgi:hypothetical protein
MTICQISISVQKREASNSTQGESLAYHQDGEGTTLPNQTAFSLRAQKLGRQVRLYQVRLSQSRFQREEKMKRCVNM